MTSTLEIRVPPHVHLEYRRPVLKDLSPDTRPRRFALDFGRYPIRHSQVMGSTVASLTYTMKCRWQAVTRPVLPEYAMSWRRLTC